MFGAIIGDYVGSVYETSPIYSRYFDLFKIDNYFTDDSVLTAALSEAIMYDEDITKMLIKWTVKHPKAGYGQTYFSWARDTHLGGVALPAGTSWGNGCIMRNSPVILLSKNLDEALEMAHKQCATTHASPEAFLSTKKYTQLCFETLMFAIEFENNNAALSAEDKIEAKKKFFFSKASDLGMTFEQLDRYCMDGFHVDVVSTLPRALACIHEANTYEEMVKNAIFIGGDCDTNAAVGGSAAEIIFGLPSELIKNFYAFCDMQDSRVQEVLTMVAHSYLKSPHRHYFYNSNNGDNEYLNLIQNILKTQNPEVELLKSAKP